jgi:tetratricopeptide (TPR) repeat protein
MQNRPLSLGDAAEFLRQRQPQSAILICEQLLSDRQAAPEVLELLAEAHVVTGQTDLAIRALQQLVRVQPDNVGALRRLGYFQLSIGAAADASVSLTAALHFEPGHARTLNNLGQAQIRLVRTAEAIGSFEAAIRHAPDYAIAHFNLGSVMLQQDHPERALESFARAARIDRGFVEANVECGNVLLRMRRPSDALSYFTLALETKPHYDALLGRAAALGDLERYEESVRTYRLAGNVRPDQAAPLWQCARILLKLAQAHEALDCCNRALSLQGDCPAAHNVRGMALSRLGEYRAALGAFNAAIAIRPGDPAFYCNRGAVLRSLDERDDALANYRKAIELDPAHAESYNNLGTLLCERHDLDGALSAYDRAIEINPAHESAYLNRAFALLLAGDFERGWREHERQYCDASGQIKSMTDIDKPALRGDEPLGGKKILLHSEQGFGDTILFCRYAPLAAAAGAEVILRVQPALRTLMRSVTGIAGVAADGDPLPDFDYQCSLFRLPFLFRTTLSNIPANVPYLRADSERTEFWRCLLGERRRPRVGLVWSSGFHPHQPGSWVATRRRNIPLLKLAPWRAPGIDFFSLQVGESAQAELARLTAARWSGPEIIDHTPLLRDFSDTAALIENLDLVITVDTAVAHLSGALAKPVWILIRFDTCWRRLLGRQDSPWYPTARLFRQSRAEEWDSVIEEVKSELANLP